MGIKAWRIVVATRSEREARLLYDRLRREGYGVGVPMPVFFSPGGSSPPEEKRTLRRFPWMRRG